MRHLRIWTPARQRWLFGALPALATVLLAGCLYAPLGPSSSATTTGTSPIPTVSATAGPGQNVATVSQRTLGQVPCSGSSNGASAAILRSNADWTRWMAGVVQPSPPGALDLSSFNFNAETVLILQVIDSGNPVTVPLNIWDVDDRGSYLVVRSDLSYGADPAQTGCKSVAIAIPATAKGAAWTICMSDPDYHCLTPVTP